MRYLLYYAYNPRHGSEQLGWAPKGISHQRSQLQVLCREAAWLGRTPVFPRIIPLIPHHNFGLECNFPLRKYLDTEKIELVCRLNGKTRTLSLCSIHAEQLRELQIPAEQILEIDYKQPVTAEQNRCFRLVVRRVPAHDMWNEAGYPLLAESCAHDTLPARDLVPGRKDRFLQVILHPAAGVRELAAEIIRQLPPDYCAVHVRRGDTLKFPAVRTLTSPGTVSRALAQAGIAPGAPVYLMSDEKSRGWLHALRKQRPGILHYTDFPRLVQLVRPDPPRRRDNYFLFCVEQEILRHAARRFLSKAGSVHAEDLKGTEYILPVHCYRYKVVGRVHHPAEYLVPLRRAQLEQSLQTQQNLFKKIKHLVEHGTPWYQAIMVYWVLRLFTPQKLQRYRNRRKALNIPV